MRMKIASNFDISDLKFYSDYKNTINFHSLFSLIIFINFFIKKVMTISKTNKLTNSNIKNK